MNATRRTMLVAIALGLLACFIGLMASGAGHGWNTPILFSPICIIAYPFAFALHGSGADRRSGWWLLAAALLLDGLLALVAIREGFDHIDRVSGRAAIWIALWFGWQAVAIAAVSRSPRVRA